MDWCVAEAYNKANHNPTAILNGDATKKVLELAAKPGETVELTAAGSKDPDGNTVTYHWFVYREAGRLRNEIKLSATSGETTSLEVPTSQGRGRGGRGGAGGAIHVVLTVQDNGAPSLVAYRRAIIAVQR
jgi:hypothetical protein